MNHIIMVLLHWLLEWMDDHPDAALTRWLLTEHGPRGRTLHITRLDRFKNALAVLGWAAAFAGLDVLIAWLGFGHNWPGADHPVTLAGLVILTPLALCFLIIGLFRLIRVII